MSSKTFLKKNEERSERWVRSLLELATQRGDTLPVAQRAVQLTRDLNISPWIALGVSEGLITLQEARVLDRVGRCKELQPAILDKRRSLEELRVMMPYASHFLAVDLMNSQADRKCDIRVLIRILDGLLGAERKTGGDDEISFRVRTRSLEEYSAAVNRILSIMKRTRCDAGMALDVDAGRVTEQFAVDYVIQKRALENEERRMMSPIPDLPPRFPQRRGEGETRRPVFQRPDHSPSPHVSPVRDHWPKDNRAPVTRDHWPK